MEGNYIEGLKTGGTLTVYPTGWEISYYFPGPDRRYNGEFVNIPGERVPSYIDAWRRNFEEYQRLKGTIPSEGSFSKQGLCGMTIGINGFRDGVSLNGWKMLASTKERIDAIIADYEYAAKKAGDILGKVFVVDHEDARPSETNGCDDTPSGPADRTPEDNAEAIVENYLYGLNDFLDLDKDKGMSLDDIRAGLEYLTNKGILKGYSFSLDWAVPDDELFAYTSEGKE